MTKEANKNKRRKLRAILAKMEPERKDDIFNRNVEDDLTYITQKVESFRDSSERISGIQSEIDSLREYMVNRMSDLSPKSIVADLSQYVSSVDDKLHQLGKTNKDMFDGFSKELRGIMDGIEASGKVSRSELDIIRIQSLNRGGSIPLQVSVNSKVANVRYADINIISSGATVVNNDVTKKTDITLIGGGGGSATPQQPLTGALGQGTFTWATAPGIIFIDHIPYVQTSSDGTSNWTGTTTTVLQNAYPINDIFAL